jgi:hypothetical protein
VCADAAGREWKNNTPLGWSREWALRRFHHLKFEFISADPKKTRCSLWRPLFAICTRGKHVEGSQNIRKLASGKRKVALCRTVCACRRIECVNYSKGRVENFCVMLLNISLSSSRKHQILLKYRFSAYLNHKTTLFGNRKKKDSVILIFFIFTDATHWYLFLNLSIF